MVKYAPKKVFILENGNYKEITYSELKQLEQADKSYMDKFFLPLHGMLKYFLADRYFTPVRMIEKHRVLW